MPAYGDHADSVLEILYPIITICIEPYVEQLTYDLIELVVQILLHMFSLLIIAYKERSIGYRVPSMYPVDLVRHHHKGSFEAFQYLQALYGLRLETFIDIDHHDSKICKRSPAASQGCERMMTGSVNKQQARYDKPFP